MNGNGELRFRTELAVNERFLRKVMWKSISASWRKTYYIVIGVVNVLLIGAMAWLAVRTGDYRRLITYCVLFSALVALIVVSLRKAVRTSLQRWKEQNHEEPAHGYAGFSDEGLEFGITENHSLLYYADMYKVFSVDGVWIIRTRAGQLVFYNAAQLSEPDRAAALEELRNRCPRIKLAPPQ